MQSLWPFAFGLLIGIGIGVIGVVRWYLKQARKPEFARDMLKSFYKNSHPHWLQVSQTDTRKVCPVCGWTDSEGKNSEIDKDAPKVPLAETSSEEDRSAH